MTDPRSRLNERIARGGAWMLAQQLTQQILIVGRFVVLARLIAPEEFGVLGMATLAMSILAALTETGLHQAIIQKRELTARTLDAAWTTLAARGVLLALALFAGAGLVADFFGEARAAPVLRVLSLAVLLDGGVSLAATLLRKNLDFRRYFWFQTGGLLVELVVTLALALLWRNVWALVAGRIAGALTRVCVSYAIGRRAPRIVWDRAELRELERYGRWLTASSIFLLILGQGDGTYVGKVFGAEALAYYQWAYRLSNIPATAISEVIAMVMFPAYSVVQDRREEIGALYIRVLRVTALLALPVAALIGASAPHVVPVFLGERWLPIVPLIAVLSLYGAVRALGATTGALFLAVGRPEIRTALQGGQLVMFLVLLVPFANRFGTLGVALAIATHAVVFNLAAVGRASRLAGVPLRRAGLEIAGPFLASLVAIAAAVVTGRFLLRVVAPWTVIVVSFAALAAYLACMFVWDRQRNDLLRHELGRVLAMLGSRGRPVPPPAAPAP